MKVRLPLFAPILKPPSPFFAHCSFSSPFKYETSPPSFPSPAFMHSCLYRPFSFLVFCYFFPVSLCNTYLFPPKTLTPYSAFFSKSKEAGPTSDQILTPSFPYFFEEEFLSLLLPSFLSASERSSPPPNTSPSSLLPFQEFLGVFLFSAILTGALISILRDVLFLQGCTSLALFS